MIPLPTSTVVLTMARRFDAEEKAVFDAWTKPELMRQWLFTSEDTNQVVKNNLQPGGSWEIVDRREGADYRAIGEYLELKAPHRLIFTFKMPQFSDAEDRVSVWISPVQDACEMTFTQEITVPHEEGWNEGDIKKAGEEFSSQSEEGWGLMFENLKHLVEIDQFER